MKEGTKRWIEKANRDLEVARRLYRDRFYDYTCYFSQQAVEKYLKAFLIENNKKYPRTHDIKYLINLCSEIDRDFEYLFDIKADKLTIYSTETRYPEYEFEVDETMAKEALEIAEKVRNFVFKKLKAGKEG